ncbi:protein ITPRID1-like isoform X2 [Narcine bancroftii]|uniref:protein ITPRID1-like isoform X2 n=1 Tax=Narcine bancroftii TaxID=1343680 RepID=UPI0038320B21
MHQERQKIIPFPFTMQKIEITSKCIQEWLNTKCLSFANEDRPLIPQEAGTRQRIHSTQDDLMLSVEATLYPNRIQQMSIKEYARSIHSQNHLLTRQRSRASATSLNVGPKSVFEFMELWHSDPEEVLLDLGFGKEESDISDKIPGRFISRPSCANGINIGVFLDAQKLRMQTETFDLYKTMTQKLDVVKMRTVDTKKESKALQRRISQNNSLQNVKDSHKFEESREREENTLSPLGRARKHAHQFIPEVDSILSSLIRGQKKEQKKAPDQSLGLETAQDDPLFESSAQDGDAKCLMPQVKKLNNSRHDHSPDLFEMEEILHALKHDDCASINSQATSQENKQWPLQIKDSEQASCIIVDQASAPVSIDSGQTNSLEALCVSQEQKIFNMQNLVPCSHPLDDHQGIAVPCVGPLTEEEKEFNEDNSHLPTMPLKAMKHNSIADVNFGEINWIQKANCDIDNPYNDSESYNPATVKDLVMNQQEPGLHQQPSTALNEVVTIEIPRERWQQGDVIMALSLEPPPVLFQSDEGPPKCTLFEGSGKTRDASVQTEGSSEEYTIKMRQPDRIAKCARLEPEFQSGIQMTKSASLDTGLYIIEQNAQKRTPACCLSCHHCYCLWDGFSSAGCKASSRRSPAKTTASHSEAQLIKTLQQLQQMARAISGSPVLFLPMGTFQHHVFSNHSHSKQILQEIETMKKYLQSFRSRLVDIEQDIIEQQASVYSDLTEEEREDVNRLQTLRRVVRQEVTEIELQLEDRARQVGEVMKMMLTLLDEQSSLFSHLGALKQTEGAASEGPVCPSSIGMTSPPDTRSQELPLNKGTICSKHSMLGECLLNSMTSIKSETEVRSKTVKDTGTTEKKHGHQNEVLDFRTILQHWLFSLLLMPCTCPLLPRSWKLLEVTPEQRHCHIRPRACDCRILNKAPSVAEKESTIDTRIKQSFKQFRLAKHEMTENAN